jgi:hypothetical protein
MLHRVLLKQTPPPKPHAALGYDRLLIPASGTILNPFSLHPRNYRGQAGEIHIPGGYPCKSLCIDVDERGKILSLRAPKDTIQSLQVLLQRLEQSSDPATDPEARAELKHILLSRIANLEALEVLRVEALESASRRSHDPGDPKPAPASAIAPPQPPVPIESARLIPDPSDPVVSG